MPAKEREMKILQCSTRPWNNLNIGATEFYYKSYCLVWPQTFFFSYFVQIFDLLESV